MLPREECQLGLAAYRIARERLPSEVPVCCCRLVDGSLQVKLTLYALRGEVEVPSDEVLDALIRDVVSRAVGVDVNADRLGDTEL